jgi:hypothetical protein
MPAMARTWSVVPARAVSAVEMFFILCGRLPLLAVCRHAARQELLLYLCDFRFWHVPAARDLYAKPCFFTPPAHGLARHADSLCGRARSCCGWFY